MPKQILIVDDERDITMLLREYLEQKGYRIEEVHTGAEALKRIFRGGFDLVLLDYEMRDIKGDRICAMIRDDKTFGKLPVIIVTAHIEMDEKIFKDYGATEVIYKPVNSEDLIGTIEKHLRKS